MQRCRAQPGAAVGNDMWTCSKFYLQLSCTHTVPASLATPISGFQTSNTFAQVELGASGSDAKAAVCCMLDPELQRQDEDDTSSLQKAAAGQTLALSAGTELQVREFSWEFSWAMPFRISIIIMCTSVSSCSMRIHALH